MYGECENYAVMKGHTGAIMELQYSTDGRLVRVIIVVSYSRLKAGGFPKSSTSSFLWDPYLISLLSEILKVQHNFGGCPSVCIDV